MVMDNRPFPELRRIVRDLNDSRIWVYAEWVSPGGHSECSMLACVWCKPWHLAHLLRHSLSSRSTTSTIPSKGAPGHPGTTTSYTT
jgi:hypothetical protein